MTMINGHHMINDKLKQVIKDLIVKINPKDINLYSMKEKSFNLYWFVITLSI